MRQVGYEGESKNPNESRALARMYDHWLKLPKLSALDPEADETVIAKVRHTMRKGEKLMQWYARTGLSRSQILKMSRDEIARFVAQAEVNARDDVRPPSPQEFDVKPPQPSSRPIAMVGQ